MHLLELSSQHAHKLRCASMSVVRCSRYGTTGYAVRDSEVRRPVQTRRVSLMSRFSWVEVLKKKRLPLHTRTCTGKGNSSNLCTSVHYSALTRPGISLADRGVDIGTTKVRDEVRAARWQRRLSTMASTAARASATPKAARKLERDRARFCAIIMSPKLPKLY